MAGLERVPKRGRNEFHKYDYVMEADLADAVRQEMAAAGILMYPDVESVEWQTGNEKGGKIATVSVRYTLTDGTDSISFRVAGCGVDNPGDKAVYKALTGSVKYALMKMFLIPTGDDPEAEKEDHSSAGIPSRPSSRDDSAASRNTSPVSASAPSTQDKDGVVAFGKNKGKHISSLTDEDLEWWTKVCQEGVDKQDPKWHKLNEKKLAACLEEWKKRNPWRSVWAKAKEIASKHGVGEAGLIDIVKGATGKGNASELIPSDIKLIEEAFKAIDAEIDSRS
jgi:hypothetical protein